MIKTRLWDSSRGSQVFQRPVMDRSCSQRAHSSGKETDKSKRYLQARMIDAKTDKSPRRVCAVFGSHLL